VRAYIQEEAERLGFNTQVDNTGNLVVRIPAKQNQKKKVVLQSHLDMVCEKNRDVIHDFAKDPLKLKVIEISDESWITAEGTTLGADNGVGIAYALTIMKKIYHGELNYDSLAFDVLFTVDEETGLGGATKMDKDFISGDYLINLDSEEDDRVTIGCAGGNNFSIKMKIEKMKLNPESQALVPFKISISGLLGGHSGVDIHKGRANAVKILVQIIWEIANRYSISLESFKGGNKHNAIPREANVTFYAQQDEEKEIENYSKQLLRNISQNYDGIEQKIELLFERLEKTTGNEVLSKPDQESLFNVLFAIPNGVISKHPKISDLVHTSTNLAAIDFTENSVNLLISQRSLSNFSLKLIHDRILALFNLVDLEYEIIVHGEYPSWTPNFDSKLLEFSKECYKDLFQTDIIVQAIHAGLECAEFKNLFPQMEMISIGPNIEDVHSPDEKLSVSSVGKFWNFLTKLISKFI
jgi:dipeptidase D